VLYNIYINERKRRKNIISQVREVVISTGSYSISVLKKRAGDVILFNEGQKKGIGTELLCAVKFIERGYIVSVPYGNNSRYDIVVDLGGLFIRVQCKTASLNKNGSYTISTSNMVSTTTQRKVKHYTKNQIDFIGSIIEDMLVLIPVSEIEKTKSKIFRTELPKHGTKSNCNLIEDYSFEKQILPLIAEEE
jgi:hexokinase